MGAARKTQGNKMTAEKYLLIYSHGRTFLALNGASCPGFSVTTPVCKSWDTLALG